MDLKMLEKVIKNTEVFVASVPKAKRKKYGQFFTNGITADFMSSLFNFNLSLPVIHILDAGAGSGILSAATVDKLISLGYKGKISLTCYETDVNVLPILHSNLLLLHNEYGIEYNIIQDNYITSQDFECNTLFSVQDNVYDYIIGNPPYLKIPKDAEEAKSMPSVCYGAPNLYFLFWAMGVHNLIEEGELVYIVPRSWTSGAYFKKFREYIFKYCVITDIHLFESRDKVFDGESVLQETVIIKVKKTTVKPEFINITSSSTSLFSDLKSFKASYDTVVSRNQFVYLVTNKCDAEILSQINRFDKTLPDINLRMQTGLIVDFRTREVLRDSLEEGSYPLLYSQHIKNGRVIWPLGKEGEVIKTDRKSFLQENGDFLMVKRFTSKEETKRLQCGIYLKQKFPQFQYISTQNKINFIKCDSTCIAYGLFVLLNSSFYDKYYRILNGSTQVNSTEINQMPVPDRALIENMGQDLMHKELSVANCNEIFTKWIN